MRRSCVAVSVNTRHSTPSALTGMCKLANTDGMRGAQSAKPKVRRPRSSAADESRDYSTSRLGAEDSAFAFIGGGVRS